MSSGVMSSTIYEELSLFLALSSSEDIYFLIVEAIHLIRLCSFYEKCLENISFKKQFENGNIDHHD